jgi:hypothetical protein
MDYIFMGMWAVVGLAFGLAVDALITASSVPRVLTLAVLLLAAANLVMLHRIRHYPLMMQDRIIRLEMRLRLQKLLPADRHWEINGLSMSQLIALRFASDEELPPLMRKVLDEHIADRDAIKKMVKDWEPDDYRI